MKTDEKTDKNLRYSIFDGAFSAAMIGFGESFLVPFAVFLKATNVQVGLLSSLPQALGSLAQPLSNRLLRLLGSRKRLVAASAFLQALMYVPIALVFFLGTLRVYHLIFFACLYWVFGMLLSPAWNSWMGDITDERMRGAYFGRRNKITGFSTFAAFLLAGYILENFGGSENMQYAGFAAVFAMALGSRLLSYHFIRKVHEPPFTSAPEAEFGFVQFVREARRRNYGLFVIFLSLMTFSVYLSAPFFTPYMLSDLGFTYLTFTAVNLAALLAKLLSMPVWGRAVDRYGARKVLTLNGYLLPVIPLLWMFSGDVTYLIVLQAYSGFIWGGFEISSFSFIFDTTTPQKRATCVAHYNLMNGLALISGAMLGSLIVKYNDVFWSKYFMVFLVSCLARYAVSFLLLPRLREVRMVEPIAYPRLFLKVVSTMPTAGAKFQLIPFRKKLKETGKYPGPSQ